MSGPTEPTSARTEAPEPAGKKTQIELVQGQYNKACSALLWQGKVRGISHWETK